MQPRTVRLCALLLAVITGGLALFHVSAAPSATVIGDGTPVNCTSQALQAALAVGGEITFNCGPDPLTLYVDEMTVATAATVDGGGLITLSGEEERRPFLVNTGASLTLRNIVVADGRADSPGGAVWNQGTLLIQNSTLKNNQTLSSYAGGALANDYSSHMTIENSVIEDNRATDAGAIYTRSALTITGSTIRNNTAHNEAGGNYGGGAILQEVLEDASTVIVDSVI